MYIDTTVTVVGLSKDAIQLCHNWMTPFAKVAGLLGVPKLREFDRVRAEDEHNIQTHTDYLTMLVSIFFLSFKRENSGAIIPVSVISILV